MIMPKHIPVMLNQSIDAMKIIPNGVYVDATFGFGGHSKKILDSLGDDGRLYAVDKDTYAISMMREDVANDKRFNILNYISRFNDFINSINLTVYA